MSPALREYVRTCHRHPSASVPVKTFVSAFRQSLPQNKRAEFPRTRILSELLAAGYRVGSNGRVFSIAGLSLGEFREDGGNLVLVAEAR